MKLYIKYMVSIRCKMTVKEALNRMGLHYVSVDLGDVEVNESLSQDQLKQLKLHLLESGLELMDDQRAMLIERIKNVILEMVHHTEELPRVNFSDFLAEKLGYNYTYLSNMFSETTGVTIEYFMISHKIEKVKELLLYNELNLTEISYKLNYSSVAHLSNQFKKVTGLTPSYFKQIRKKRREMTKSMDDISPVFQAGTPDLKIE